MKEIKCNYGTKKNKKKTELILQMDFILDKKKHLNIN